MTDLETARSAEPVRLELSRSFVLAPFTFLWFFIVPIPPVGFVGVRYRISPTSRPCC